MLFAYLALWWAFQAGAWCSENSRVEKAAGVKDTALISEILDKLHKIKA